MSFLDIKDPAERASLFNEYVTPMKTVKQRNMVNRGMLLVIVDELQSLFHSIVNVTNQAAEETRKELAPMKKTLTDIDGALAAQRVDARPPLRSTTDPRPRLDKGTDTTFGLFQRQDGRLGMGNKVVHFGASAKTLLVDEYKLTSGLLMLITNKHPRPDQWKTNDYKVYKSLVAQTKIKSFPNWAGTARPHATWKWKHMIRKMVIPGEGIPEGEQSEDTDDTGR